MDRDLLLQIIHFRKKPRPDHVKQLSNMLSVFEPRVST